MVVVNLALYTTLAYGMFFNSHARVTIHTILRLLHNVLYHHLTAHVVCCTIKTFYYHHFTPYLSKAFEKSTSGNFHCSHRYWTPCCFHFFTKKDRKIIHDIMVILQIHLIFYITRVLKYYTFLYEAYLFL